MNAASNISNRDSNWNPWFWLLAAVTMIDLVATHTKQPTLTAVFRDALRHPTRRWTVITCWALVSSHLFTGHP